MLIVWRGVTSKARGLGKRAERRHEQKGEEREHDNSARTS